MSKLVSAFGAFCVATVITQIILIGFLLFQGSVNSQTMTKVAALINGIDITGNRLQQIMRDAEDREQPDFDDILEARKMMSLDMDVRLRSQKEHRDELSTMMANVKEATKKLDERLVAFRGELEQLRNEALEKGMEDVQRTIQNLDSVQAKQQLLIMYDEGRVDDVVTIVKAMSSETRSNILGEFVDQTNGEPEKLAEILRRIGEGMPTTGLIDATRDGL